MRGIDDDVEMAWVYCRENWKLDVRKFEVRANRGGNSQPLSRSRTLGCCRCESPRATDRQVLVINIGKEDAFPGHM